MAGKFSAKNRENAVDVRTILAEREQAQKRRSGSPNTTPKRKLVQPATATMPSFEKSAKPIQKPRRGPRLSGVIFYTIFFLCIFLFYTATYFGLLELREWLNRYEMAQPTAKSQAVFQELFSDPDWGTLYDTALIQNTAFESKDAFVRFMESTVGEQVLTCAETSAGLSGDKKYVVRMGNEKIAAFTLVDHNKSVSLTTIPDWQLGSVEFFFAREESYWIEKLDGHTVYVNDVALDDRFTVKIRSVAAEEYLPIGLTGVRRCTQQISGLTTVPTVRIVDANGAEAEILYDEESHTFTEQSVFTTIGDAEQELAINAVKTDALYMLKQAGEADIAKYFMRGSDAFNAITDTERGFVQDAASWEFTNEKVADYCRYSDNLFSVRVSVTLNQYRSNGSVKESAIEQSLFFEQQDSGKWLCYAMTAVDVSKPSEQVRLTFMEGDTVLSSDFYDAGITELTCPIVSTPEGKVFLGWAMEEKDESGNTVISLVFQPDENGNVILPSGTTLQPMTLLPLFE